MSKKDELTKNPIRTDPELLTLTKRLAEIKKHKSFNKWREKFLNRLEDFIYDSGMKPADESCKRFSAHLDKQLVYCSKVTAAVEKGDLSEDRKTVKASLALQEMCKRLSEIVEETQTLIPAVKNDEKVKGFNKYHLGASLVRQGFPQYGSMKAVEAFVQEMGPRLKNIADRQQLELFDYYVLVFSRFVDVIKDIGLYETMLACEKFRVPPEVEESTSVEIMTVNLSVAGKDSGKVVSMEVEVTETVGNIKEYIADQFGIVPAEQVLAWNDKELDDNGKTLEDLGIQDAAKFTVEQYRIPVLVNVPGSGQIEVKVNPSDYIADLKRQLEEAGVGIAAPNQILTLDGEELADPNASIGNSKISRGTVLDLEPKNLSLKVADPDGNIHVLKAAYADPIDSIKEQIANVTGIPATKQVLSHEGTELPSGVLIKETGLRDGDTIDVARLKIPVRVDVAGGASLDFMVDPDDYISEVKRQIEKAGVGIPAKNQRLSLHGADLNDNETATAGGITSGCTIDLEPKNLSLKVVDPDGNSHVLKASYADPIETIKEQIENLTGIPVAKQVLSHQDNEIPSGPSIKEAGLRDGDTLDVGILKIPVRVNVHGGDPIELMVDPEDYISEIKRQLEKEGPGIPAQNQRLSLDSTELDDNVTATAAGITSGCTIDLEPKSIDILLVNKGVSHKVTIDPSKKVDELRDIVESVMGIPKEVQTMKHNGNPLSPETTLRQSKVLDGDSVNVQAVPMPIHIHLPNGENVELLVDPTDPLSSIKKNLEEVADIPSNKQRLILDDAELNGDSKNAWNHGLRPGKTIVVERNQVTLNVVAPDGTSHQIEVDPRKPTEELKEMIADKTGIVAKRQVVKHNGNDLQPGKSVGEMGISDGDTLTVDTHRIPVVIRTMDGESFDMTLDPAEDLSILKSDIESKVGMPVAVQRLLKDGKELKDNKSADHYGILPGDVLELEPKSLRIYVEAPNGVIFDVEVEPSDSISDIQAMIAKETGMVPAEQVLSTNGQPLESGTVRSSKLKDGDKIIVDIFKIPVKVNVYNGHQIDVMVNPHRAVVDLKRALESESGLEASNQRLSSGDHSDLSDGKPVSEYGVVAGSVLDLEPRSIELSVRTPDNQVHTISVRPGDTIDSLKTRIADASGFAVPRQVLKHGGKALVDGTKKIRECGIQPGASLTVDLLKIPVNVVQDNGDSFRLEVEPSQSVSDLKQMCQESTGIKAKKQTLTLGNNELSNNGASLEQSGITAGCTLRLGSKTDNIVFADMKCGTLFGVDRDDAIEQGILTPVGGNNLDFQETAKDSITREKIIDAVKTSPKLGVSRQIVVQGQDVDDYDIAEAEKVKGVWGVSLKKVQKNKKGEEFVFIDPKTGACGELSRKTCLEKKFITEIQDPKEGRTIAEREQDVQTYDRYVASIRNVFGI